MNRSNYDIPSESHRHNARHAARMPIFSEDVFESTEVQKSSKNFNPELYMNALSGNFRSMSNASNSSALEALQNYGSVVQSPTLSPKQTDWDVEYLCTTPRKDSNDMKLSSQMAHAYSSATPFSNAGAATPFNNLNLNNVDEEDEFLYGDSNSLPEEPKAFENNPVEANMKLANSGWSDEDDYFDQSPQSNLNSNVWKQSSVTNFQDEERVVSEVPQNTNKEKLISSVTRKVPLEKTTDFEFHKSFTHTSVERPESFSTSEINSNTTRRKANRNSHEVSASEGKSKYHIAAQILRKNSEKSLNLESKASRVQDTLNINESYSENFGSTSEPFKQFSSFDQDNNQGYKRTVVLKSSKKSYTGTPEFDLRSKISSSQDDPKRVSNAFTPKHLDTIRDYIKSSSRKRAHSPGEQLHVLRQSSHKGFKDDSPSRNQSPSYGSPRVPARLRSPPSVRHRSPPSVRNRSPPSARHRSPPSVRHRSPPSTRHRSPPSARHRSPPSSRHRSPPSARRRSPIDKSRSPLHGSRHRSPDFDRYHSRDHSPKYRSYEKRRHSRSPIAKPREKSPGYYRRRTRSPSFSRSQERSRSPTHCRSRDRSPESKYYKTNIDRSRSDKPGVRTDQRKNTRKGKSEDTSDNSSSSSDSGSSSDSNSKESSIEKEKSSKLSEKSKDIGKSKPNIDNTKSEKKILENKSITKSSDSLKTNDLSQNLLEMFSLHDKHSEKEGVNINNEIFKEFNKEEENKFFNLFKMIENTSFISEIFEEVKQSTQEHSTSFTNSPTPFASVAETSNALVLSNHPSQMPSPEMYSYNPVVPVPIPYPPPVNSYPPMMPSPMYPPLPVHNPPPLPPQPSTMYDSYSVANIPPLITFEPKHIAKKRPPATLRSIPVSTDLGTVPEDVKNQQSVNSPTSHKSVGLSPAKRTVVLKEVVLEENLATVPKAPSESKSEQNMLIEKYKKMKAERHIAQSKVNSAADDIVEMRKRIDEVWGKKPVSSSTEKVFHTKCKNLLSLSTDIMGRHIKEAKRLDEELNRFKGRLPRELLPEIAKIKVENCIKDDTTPSEAYTCFDSGKHMCYACNKQFPNILSMMDHLHSSEHKEHNFETEWIKQFRKEPKIEEKKGSLHAVAGMEFVKPITGFFCTLCKESLLDSASAEQHLKSSDHLVKYKNYLKDHPLYEKKHLFNVYIKYSTSTKEKKKKEINEQKTRMRIEETVGEKENQLAKRKKQEEADEKLKEMLKDQKSKEKKVEELEESGSDTLASQNQKGPGIKLTLSQEKEESKQKVNTKSKDAKTVQKYVYIGRAPNYKARPKEKPSAKEKSCPWYKRDIFAKNVAENESAPNCTISSTVDALSKAKNENSSPQSKHSSATESNVSHKTTVTLNPQIAESNTENESRSLNTNSSSKSKSLCKHKRHLNSGKSKVLSEAENNDIKSNSDISKKAMTKSTKHKLNESQNSDPSLGSKSNLPKITEKGKIKYTAVNQAIQNILHGTDSAIHQANVSLSDINLPKNNTQNLDSPNKQLNLKNTSDNESVSMDISPVKYPDIVYSLGTLPKAYTAEEEKDFLILGINKDDMRPIAIPVPPPMSVLNFCSSAAEIPYSTLSQVTSRIITVPPPPLPVHTSTALSDGSYTALSQVNLSVPPPPLPAPGSSHISVPPPPLPNQVSSHISVPPPPLLNQVNSHAISVPPPSLLPNTISSPNICVPPPTHRFSLLPTPNSCTNLSDYAVLPQVSSYNMPFNRNNLDAMQYVEGRTSLQYVEGGTPRNHGEKSIQQSTLHQMEIIKLQIMKDRLQLKKLSGDKNSADRNLITINPSKIVSSPPAYSTAMHLNTSSPSGSSGVISNKKNEIASKFKEKELTDIKLAFKNSEKLKCNTPHISVANETSKMASSKKDQSTSKEDIPCLLNVKEKSNVEESVADLTEDVKCEDTADNSTANETSIVTSCEKKEQITNKDMLSESNMKDMSKPMGIDQPLLEDFNVKESVANITEDIKCEDIADNSTTNETFIGANCEKKEQITNKDMPSKSNMKDMSKPMETDQLLLEDFNIKESVADITEDIKCEDIADNSTVNETSIGASCEKKDQITDKDMLSESNIKDMSKPMKINQPLEDFNVKESVANITADLKCEDIAVNCSANKTSYNVSSGGKDGVTNINDVLCTSNVKEVSKLMQTDKPAVLEFSNVKQSVAGSKDIKCYVDNAGNETSGVACSGVKYQCINKDALCLSNVKYDAKPMNMDQPVIFKDSSTKESVANSTQDFNYADIVVNSIENKICDMAFSMGKEDDVLCAINVEETSKPLQVNEPVVLEDFSAKESITDSNEDVTCEDVDNAANKTSDVACSGVENQDVNKDYMFCLKTDSNGSKPSKMNQNIILKHSNAKEFVVDSTEDLKCEDTADNNAEKDNCYVDFTEDKDQITNEDYVLCALNVKKVSKPMQVNESVVLENSNTKESIADSNKDLTCEEVDDTKNKTSNVACSEVEDQCINKDLDEKQPTLDEYPQDLESTGPLQDFESCKSKNHSNSISQPLLHDFATSDMKSDAKAGELVFVKMPDTVSVLKDTLKISNLNIPVLDDCRKKKNSVNQSPSAACLNLDLHELDLIANAESVSVNEIMPKLESESNSNVSQLILDESHVRCSQENFSPNLETSESRKDLDTVKEPFYGHSNSDLCKLDSKTDSEITSAAKIYDEAMPQLENQSKKSNVSQPVLDECSKESFLQNFKIWASNGLNSVTKSSSDDQPKSDLCKLDLKANVDSVSVSKVFDEAMPTLENQNSKISQPVLDKLSEENCSKDLKSSDHKDLFSVKEEPLDDSSYSDLFKLDLKTNAESDSCNKEIGKAISNADLISVKEEPSDDSSCSYLFKSDLKTNAEYDSFNKEVGKTISNVDKDKQNTLLGKDSNYSQANLPESNAILLIDLTEDSCDNEECSKSISPTRVESTNFVFAQKSGSCISGDATMKEHSNTFLSLDIKYAKNTETADNALNKISAEEECYLRSEQFQTISDEIMDSSSDLSKTITAATETQDGPEITSKAQIPGDLIEDSVDISDDSDSDIAEEFFEIEEPMDISKDSNTGDHKEDSDTDEYENEND